MLTRRELLAAWLAAAATGSTGLVACDGRESRAAPSPGPAGSPPTTAKAPGPRTRTVEGVEVHELFTNGASESSPMIVAIHGRGDHPRRWVEAWRSFPRTAHVVVPRAFEPFGDGFSWFSLRPDMTQDEIAASLGGAEARLWPALAKIAGSRKPIVTGFSQGGMLSFAIAARHGEAVARAFPVAGACPASLLPPAGKPAAPIVAFHGTSDPVIAFAFDRSTVDALTRAGHDAQLRSYPGVGHTLTNEMHDQLWAEIGKSLPA